MSNKELTLYSVTLPWHPRDPDQGTYSTSVWGEDPDEAILMVAQAMAVVGEKGDNEDEMRKWAEDLVESANISQKIVMRVVDTIQQDLRDLLAGPDGNASDTEAKLREIMEILGEPVSEVQRERPRG